MTTYNVSDMRVIFPSGKVAEKNPDRFATIYGKFHDENGNPLSIPSKEVTLSMAESVDFSIDIEKGILTLPSGHRGRPVSKSVSQDDINSRLAALRKPTK